jgi:hypothetical protein
LIQRWFSRVGFLGVRSSPNRKGAVGGMAVRVVVALLDRVEVVGIGTQVLLARVRRRKGQLAKVKIRRKAMLVCRTG